MVGEVILDPCEIPSCRDLKPENSAFRCFPSTSFYVLIMGSGADSRIEDGRSCVRKASSHSLASDYLRKFRTRRINGKGVVRYKDV